MKRPTHLPQNILVQTLLKNVDPQNIRFGSEVIGVEQRDSKFNVKTRSESIECEFLYGCDGLNGMMRQSMGVQLVGQREIQNFINVHFTSEQLRSVVTPSRSMLTFIYNRDVVGVLISNYGDTFTLQIPLDLLMPSYDREVSKKDVMPFINALTSSTLPDVDIKSIGLWRMGALIANSYVHGRAILLGDAAHSFPPAGGTPPIHHIIGFGMNTGIQDAHNLAHKIKQLQGAPHLEGMLLNAYEIERKQIAYENMNVSMKYYKLSLDIARVLGYDYGTLQAYKGLGSVLDKLGVYQLGLKYGTTLLDTSLAWRIAQRNLIQLEQSHPGLIPLVFPEQETCFRYSNSPFLDSQKELVGMLLPNWATSKGVGLRQWVSELNQSRWSVVYMEERREVPLPEYVHDAVHLDVELKEMRGVMVIRPDLHIYGVY